MALYSRVLLSLGGMFVVALSTVACLGFISALGVKLTPLSVRTPPPPPPPCLLLLAVENLPVCLSVCLVVGIVCRWRVFRLYSSCLYICGYCMPLEGVLPIAVGVFGKNAAVIKNSVIERVIGGRIFWICLFLCEDAQKNAFSRRHRGGGAFSSINIVGRHYYINRGVYI